MDLTCFNSLPFKKLDRSEHQLLKRFILANASQSNSNCIKWSTFNAHNEINYFHNIVAHFSDTMLQLTNSRARIYTISWNRDSTWLILGFDNGLLKVFKTEADSKFVEEKGNDNWHGYLTNSIDIKSWQTLECHSVPVARIIWNERREVFTTFGTNGEVITWKLHEGKWYKEMVAAGVNKYSVVRGLAWSPDGENVAIVFEDGTILMGHVDGTRLFTKEMKESVPTGVIWSPDGLHLLISDTSGDIQVYSLDGEFKNTMKMDKYYLYGHGRPRKHAITTMNWFGGGTTIAIKAPALAVVVGFNHLYLLRGINDARPLIKETNLEATCGCWSPNGDYFAIGGRKLFLQQEGLAPCQVVLFNVTGQKILAINLLTDSCIELAWDSLSLRLAVASKSNMYFVQIRPNWKYTFYAGILVYAFGRADGTAHLGFWDQKTLQTQDVPGLIVDLKGNDRHCAILSCNRNGCYNILLLNVEGAPIESIPICGMEPFILIMTDNTICCISENSAFIWRYSGNEGFGFGRRGISFHLDEPSDIVKEPSCQEECQQRPPSDYISRTTLSPAISADAKDNLLVIVREGGQIMLFSLPTANHLVTLDYETYTRPSRVFLNSTASKVALLDINGCLLIGHVAGATARRTKTLAAFQSYERIGIWDFTWAKDNPDHFCFMEKSQLFIVRHDKVEPPIHCSGYLVEFKDLEVTMVLVDEIMQSPTMPLLNAVLKYKAKQMQNFKTLIDISTNKLSLVLKYVQQSNHIALFNRLAKVALLQLDLDVAEICLVKCEDYAGLQLVKKLATLESKDIEQGEVATFYDDFEQAEEHFLNDGRPDLAIQMWSALGEWDRVEKIDQEEEEMPIRSQLSATSVDPYTTEGDAHAKKFEWEQALVCYEKANEWDRVLDCCLILEDYEKIRKVVGKYPQLGPKVADTFKFFEIGDIPMVAGRYEQGPRPSTVQARSGAVRLPDLH